MAETNSMPSKIDRRLVGDPIQIDGYSIQPVARVRGRSGAGGSEQGGGAGGQFSLEPVEVIVRAADGAESTLALADPSAQALRSMAGVAVAVAALAVINVGRLRPPRLARWPLCAASSERSATFGQFTKEHKAWKTKWHRQPSTSSAS
jgi:hypothetical protein